MNGRIARDGHRFDLHPRTTTDVAEFQRQFGGAGNFADREVAFRKRGVRYHKRARHSENDLRSDLRASDKPADGHCQQNKNREPSSEWPHKISLRVESEFCTRGYFPSAAMSTAKKSPHTRRAATSPCGDRAASPRAVLCSSRGN